MFLVLYKLLCEWTVYTFSSHHIKNLVAHIINLVVHINNLTVYIKNLVVHIKNVVVLTTWLQDPSKLEQQAHKHSSYTRSISFQCAI